MDNRSQGGPNSAAIRFLSELRKPDFDLEKLLVLFTQLYVFDRASRKFALKPDVKTTLAIELSSEEWNEIKTLFSQEATTLADRNITQSFSSFKQEIMAAKPTAPRPRAASVGADSVSSSTPPNKPLPATPAPKPSAATQTPAKALARDTAPSLLPAVSTLFEQPKVRPRAKSLDSTQVTSEVKEVKQESKASAPAKSPRALPKAPQADVSEDEFPIGFALDIDENMMSVYIPGIFDAMDDPEGKNKHRDLSDSAKSHLSVSDTGNVRDPKLFYPNRTAVVSATALFRPEWKAFFERVANINQRYKALKPDAKPLIAIINLTNADYTATGVLSDAFTQFFGLELLQQIFVDLEHQFFNKGHQRDAVKEGDVNKGRFMDKKFDDLKQTLGVAERSRWTLVDDNHDNIKYMREHGFTGIHNPTNPASRPPGVTFTSHGASVFTALNQKLDKAERLLAKLEEAAKAKKSLT